MRGLGRDTVIYGVAMMVDRVGAIVLLPIMTAAFSKETFGAWNQILAGFALMSNILLLGFYHSAMRYLPSRPREEASRVFNGMLIIIALVSLIFLGLVTSFSAFFGNLLFATHDFDEVIIAVGAYFVSECLFEFVVLAFLRAERQISFCAIYQIVKTILRLGAIAAISITGPDLSALLWLLSFANVFLVAVVYVIHVVPSIGIHLFGLGTTYWYGVIGYSLPIVGAAIVGWANLSINRFVIVHMVGLQELATYAAAYSITSIASFLSLVITFTVVPHANAAWNQGDKQRVNSILSKGTLYYLYGTIAVAASVAAAFDPLSRLLTPGYEPPQLLVWTLAALMVLSGMEQLTTFATLMNGSLFSMMNRLAALIVNIVLCLAFVDAMGISGGALAALIAMMITVGLNIYRLASTNQFIFPTRAAMRLLMPTIGLAASTSALLKIFDSGFASMALAVTGGLAVFVMLEAMTPQSISRVLLARIMQARLPDA